jgi:hypothetical protein
MNANDNFMCSFQDVHKNKLIMERCQSPRFISKTTTRILIKFGTEDLHKKFWDEFNLGPHRFNMASSLYEVQTER